MTTDKNKALRIDDEKLAKSIFQKLGLRVWIEERKRSNGDSFESEKPAVHAYLDHALLARSGCSLELFRWNRGQWCPGHMIIDDYLFQDMSGLQSLYFDPEIEKVSFMFLDYSDKNREREYVEKPEEFREIVERVKREINRIYEREMDALYKKRQDILGRV